MVNKKTNNQQKPIIKHFFKTQILLITTIALILFFTAIIIFVSDDIPTKYFFYIAAAGLSVSNFISGFYVGYKTKKNGMLNALIYCLPINLLVLFVSVVLNSFKIDLTILFTTIIILTSSMLGGIFSVNTKTSVKH